MDLKGSYIGINTRFLDQPVLPHNLKSIFISDKARIGKDVLIFQQVTIGSDTLKNHPKNGAPEIGNNVYIGAGTKIIGNIKIGDNCRIGANCVLAKDMQANTTAVNASTRYIEHEQELEHDFISINKI